MISRKCPKCGTWNEGEEIDNCIACGYLINPKLIRKKEVEQKKKEFDARPPEQLDIILEKFKNSRFLLVRFIYYVLYSIWLVFGVAVSFILYMVAGTVG